METLFWYSNVLNPLTEKYYCYSWHLNSPPYEVSYSTNKRAFRLHYMYLKINWIRLVVKVKINVHILDYTVWYLWNIHMFSNASLITPNKGIYLSPRWVIIPDFCWLPIWRRNMSLSWPDLWKSCLPRHHIRAARTARPDMLKEIFATERPFGRTPSCVKGLWHWERSRQPVSHGPGERNKRNDRSWACPLPQGLRRNFPRVVRAWWWARTHFLMIPAVREYFLLVVWGDLKITWYACWAWREAAEHVLEQRGSLEPHSCAWTSSIDRRIWVK